MNVITYGVLGAVLFLLGVIGVSRYELSELRSEMRILEEKHYVCIGNNDDLANAIKHQNTVIELQRVEIANFKPVTITEVVTKYVPKYINVERGDCNDTHNYLDYLSTIKL